MYALAWNLFRRYTRHSIRPSAMASTTASTPSRNGFGPFSCSRLSSSRPTRWRSASLKTLWVCSDTSSPINRRIFSSCCHLPSRASSAPISKNPVAMSNDRARSLHWRRYSRPVQPDTLLSTMNRSPPPDPLTSQTVPRSYDSAAGSRENELSDTQSPPGPLGGLLGRSAPGASEAAAAGIPIPRKPSIRDNRCFTSSRPARCSQSDASSLSRNLSVDRCWFQMMASTAKATVTAWETVFASMPGS